METRLVNRYMITFLAMLAISITCFGQQNEFLQVDITADSMIRINSTRNQANHIKIYDEELVSKKKAYIKKSIFLPEGFSDHYLYEIIEMRICKNGRDDITDSLMINRNELLKLAREKIDTVIFYEKTKEKTTYMLSTLIIEE